MKCAKRRKFYWTMIVKIENQNFFFFVRIRFTKSLSEISLSAKFRRTRRNHKNQNSPEMERKLTDYLGKILFIHIVTNNSLLEKMFLTLSLSLPQSIPCLDL